MDNETYIQYKNVLEHAIDNDLFEQNDFDVNDFQNEICDIEREVKDAIDENNIRRTRNDVSTSKLKAIMQIVQQVKRKYHFYDKEAELDIMFPDRNDDDFDEDSMSCESVFGED